MAFTPDQFKSGLIDGLTFSQKLALSRCPVLAQTIVALEKGHSPTYDLATPTPCQRPTCHVSIRPVGFRQISYLDVTGNGSCLEESN